MQDEKIKNAVRYFYDLQRLRIQAKGRSAKKAEIAEAHLDDGDKAFLNRQGEKLNDIEKDALKEVKRLIKGVPIYEDFLKGVRGIGPTLSGVLIAEINIENCNTASQLWAWCGLATERYCAACNISIPEEPHEENKCPKCGGTKHYHKAVRPKRGEKLKYNPWLKSKLLKVMGDCFLKSNSPYRKSYDDYKHRKENQEVKVCMGCNGSGEVSRVEREKVVDIGTKKPRKKAECPNCEGTGGPAPWGASKAHRAAASNRYMVKQFLLDLWKEWRKLEGLEVRPPYAEEYLNRVHHS